MLGWGSDLLLAVAFLSSLGHAIVKWVVRVGVDLGKACVVTRHIPGALSGLDALLFGLGDKNRNLLPTPVRLHFLNV